MTITVLQSPELEVAFYIARHEEDISVNVLFFAPIRSHQSPQKLSLKCPFIPSV